MSDYTSNDANADSAPKQQVVNGWVARDMLRIAALQNEASAETLDGIVNAVIDSRPTPDPADQRPVRLLMILVLTLCWIGFWLIVPGAPKRPREQPVSPVLMPIAAPPPVGRERPDPPPGGFDIANTL